MLEQGNLVEDTMMNNHSSNRLMQNMDERQQRINQDREQKKRQEEGNVMMESVDQFWCAFHERKKAITTVLEGLKLDERWHYVTASQRHEGRNRLDEIQNHLLELQKYSSQCVSLFVPQADARRANEEMEQLFQQSRQARDTICPREKFTFQKYRMWRTQQRQHQHQQKDDDDDVLNEENNVGMMSTHNAASSSQLTMPPSHNNQDYFRLDSQANSYLSSDDIILVENTEAKKIHVHLTNLKNCVVTLKESYGSLKLKDNENCIFYSSPVSGPIFVERCYNCTLIVASRQLRIHDSYSLHCIIYVTSGPIIEGCSKVYFSRLYVPTLQDRFASCIPPVDINVNVLQREILDVENEYHNVKDFMWHKLLQQSPNWSLLSDDETKEYLLQLSDDRRQPKLPY